MKKRMQTTSRRSAISLVAVILTLLAGGCASTSPHASFGQVEADLEERGIEIVHWYSGTEEDEQAAHTIRELLDQTLTAKDAIQVTLLNNRRLQAVYSDLGIAQADLVQAGLLSNPFFGAELLFPIGGGANELELSVSQSFLEIFYIPLRRRVAASLLEEAKLQVTGTVLDFAYQTHISFYAVQAAAQRMEMFEQVVLATDLSYDFARRLHEAGNITELELHEQRDLYEQARIDLRRVEADYQRHREHLNRLMGVFGEDTNWQITDRLPEIPDDSPDLDRLENRVIEASLDLAIAAQRIITAGQMLGLNQTTALVPELEIGAEFERKGSHRSAGPALALPIPIFDRGQARIARNRAELRQQQERYSALAIEIRSIARESRNEMEASREISKHYQQIILPLRQRITNETQLQYNAMQVGLFKLLRAHERQIEAGEKYIHALYEYWTAQAAIDQLLRGRTPYNSNEIFEL